MSKTLEECQKANPARKLYSSLPIGGETFVFRRPNPIEWRKYKGAMLSAKMSRDDTLAGGSGQIDGVGLLNAYEALSMAVVVSHDASELQSIGDEYLDLFLVLGGSIAGAIENEMDAFSKKRVPASTKP